MGSAGRSADQSCVENHHVLDLPSPSGDPPDVEQVLLDGHHQLCPAVHLVPPDSQHPRPDDWKDVLCGHCMALGSCHHRNFTCHYRDTHAVGGQQGDLSDGGLPGVWLEDGTGGPGHGWHGSSEEGITKVSIPKKTLGKAGHHGRNSMKYKVTMQKEILVQCMANMGS